MSNSAPTDPIGAGLCGLEFWLFTPYDKNELRDLSKRIGLLCKVS
jgi:hypothetical protein